MFGCNLTSESEPHKVADRTENGGWESKNEPNSWIVFDFKDKLVCTTHIHTSHTHTPPPDIPSLSHSQIVVRLDPLSCEMAV